MTVYTEKVYLKQLQLCPLYQCPSKIHHAGFRMQAFVTFEPLNTIKSFRRTKYQLDAFHVHCTADRLAQTHRSNFTFPITSVSTSLSCRTVILRPSSRRHTIRPSIVQAQRTVSSDRTFLRSSFLRLVKFSVATNFVDGVWRRTPNVAFRN